MWWTDTAIPHTGFFSKIPLSWSIHDTICFNAEAVVREPVVSRHATRVESSGSNLINVLHTLYTGDRHFKKVLTLAMKAAFNDEFEELIFPPAADQRVQLRIRWKSLETEISAADLSAGTLQFLFLITVLMTPSPPPLIVIEEPEQYLHPAMLPIVAEHAVDASLRTQARLHDALPTVPRCLRCHPALDNRAGIACGTDTPGDDLGRASRLLAPGLFSRQAIYFRYSGERGVRFILFVEGYTDAAVSTGFSSVIWIRPD